MGSTHRTRKIAFLQAATWLLFGAVSVSSANAWADRGALSVEAGGGFSGLLLPAPYVDAPKDTPGLAPAALLGARYALSNWLELAASGFFEPQVTYFHNDVSVVHQGTLFPGTLSHSLYRYGGRAGARLVRGTIFRFALGLDVGWSHRVYKDFKAIDDSNGPPIQDYRLKLAEFSLDNALVGLVFGLEWTAGDHFSFSILPRIEHLVGADSAVAATIPLLFSYSWYL